MKLKSTEQNIFFTSDLHFGHKSILRFCPDRVTKYGDTVEKMNQEIIKDWNNTVNDDDVVFILGDVSFASIQDTVGILCQLNGELHLISGNHDSRYIEKDIFRNCFKTIQPYLKIQVDDRKICMFHFPIIEWDSCHWGSWHLFGHLHGKPIDGFTGVYKVLDAGIDSTKKTLVEFEYVKNYMQDKKILTHGDGEKAT